MDHVNNQRCRPYGLINVDAAATIKGNHNTGRDLAHGTATIGPKMNEPCTFAQIMSSGTMNHARETGPERSTISRARIAQEMGSTRNSAFCTRTRPANESATIEIAAGVRARRRNQEPTQMGTETHKPTNIVKISPCPSRTSQAMTAAGSHC